MAHNPPRAVVVVEHDEEVRRSLEEALAEAGYRVASIDKLEGLVELVRSSAADLVLSEAELPGGDGYAALRALRSDPATAGVPVIVLGEERDLAERVRAFRHGAVEYVIKPVAADALLRKIDRVLEGRSRPRTTGSTASPPAEQPGQAAAPETSQAAVQFEELDPDETEPLALDPSSLPASRGRLPSFELVPEVLRDVLVVDDNAEFRKFLRDLLGGHGFTVHEAADGEEGLRVALERRPWLILTDVRMPGGDGFEFCRRVRSHSLIRQTPLLFLSGWDDYRQRYRGLELGADDFLSKETSIRELLIRIQLLMKRYSDLARGRQEAGMSGEIEMIGAPGILQVCHLSRLSGTLDAKHDRRQARVFFHEGEVVGADCGGVAGTEAVFAFLAWESGRFQFTPGEPPERARLGTNFNQLLLEGCRRLDQSRRGPTS